MWCSIAISVCIIMKWLYRYFKSDSLGMKTFSDSLVRNRELSFQANNLYRVKVNMIYSLYLLRHKKLDNSACSYCVVSNVVRGRGVN